MSTKYFQLGLIGYPLGHSRSPELHEVALTTCGLAGEYHLFPCPPTDQGLSMIASLLRRLKQGELDGLNVTIPHKQIVIPMVERLSGVAQAVGAVNTLYIDQEGYLTGDNTDGAGFRVDLERFIGKHTGQALVLGAGGSAHAVAYALVSAGWKVIVLARREVQAIDLVNALSRSTGMRDHLRVGVLSLDSLADIRCDLIVNATPVGMYPEIERCPWPEDIAFPAHAAVYDLIYNPLETVLIRRAKAAGLHASNGSGMLAAQAALSFQRWTGVEPPLEEMRRVFD